LQCDSGKRFKLSTTADNRGSSRLKREFIPFLAIVIHKLGNKNHVSLKAINSAEQLIALPGQLER